MNLFINKLFKEGKIKIVEPSEEIAESYLEKSGKSLLSAKTLLKIENFDDAVALTYFSMYYSALALMFKCGIKSENHTGTIILLKEVFDIDNSDINYAKKERVDKQYYVDFAAKKQDVITGIRSAEEFNSIIKSFVDKMKRDDVLKYNNKARNR